MNQPRAAAGIVFALSIEADAFARQVADAVTTRGGGLEFHAGSLAGRAVAWCVAGVGRERAARATQLLLDGHRPRRVISAGFAGGLSATFPRGLLVEPAAVRGEAAGPALPLATGPVDAARPLLVTLDRIIRTQSEKEAVAHETGAGLVDMETLAVATVATEAGLPCHGLRVISDAADDELPADVGRLIEPQSGARRAGTILALLGRRPRAAADLWRLWEQAVVDGRTLASGLTRLIESIEPGA